MRSMEQNRNYINQVRQQKKENMRLDVQNIGEQILRLMLYFFMLPEKEKNVRQNFMDHMQGDLRIIVFIDLHRQKVVKSKNLIRKNV